MIVLPAVGFVAMQGELVWGRYATCHKAQRKCCELSRIFGCVLGEPIRVVEVTGEPECLLIVSGPVPPCGDCGPLRCQCDAGAALLQQAA